jgi:hypothetical protein
MKRFLRYLGLLILLSPFLGALGFMMYRNWEPTLLLLLIIIAIALWIALGSYLIDLGS